MKSNNLQLWMFWKLGNLKKWVIWWYDNTLWLTYRGRGFSCMTQNVFSHAGGRKVAQIYIGLCYEMLICWGRPCKVRLFTHIPCGADLLCPYSRLVAFRVLTCMLLTCRGGLLVTRCPPSAAASASCSSPGSAIFPISLCKFDAEPLWL